MTSPSDHFGKTVRIATGSRLHFGLVDTASPFGGVGVMIDRPVTEVVVTAAEQFSCTDSTNRVSDIADRLCEVLGLAERPACRIEIMQRAPSHHGLGTGTQLSMAVAESMVVFLGADLSGELLTTEIADRGKRSAVGSHGYFHGGMIYESSDEGHSLNAIVQRAELPDQWRVLVLRPTESAPTVSGTDEQNQFDRLGSAPASQRERLQKTVGEELLPAALSCDFEAFCDSLHRYNHDSGLLFDRVQGGPYSSRAIADLVDLLQSSGATGVGQSSWGPSVFCWCESDGSADELMQRLQATGIRIQKCRVENQPRQIQVT
ncbi:beta-ribofuranosylaminobenzene 5'-phosphate synthase [Stieleria marina]|uniref:Homoserine kinase n=1 Tax=Stieleria marina TaxID=1930275 RepID=A0A517P0R6_9BACT|nr:Homoserine kinase [Planctomycetes bacterium K23_9]